MKFLHRNKISKTILIISDIHLGAGSFYKTRRNILEDFHYDKELVEFLKYFSGKNYLNKEIELIINGDFFDLLAVPFVPFFDDEFWSEEAGLEKLKIILEAHPEVIKGLKNFLSVKNKKITFILGNHDAEMIFPSLQEEFLSCFNEDERAHISILTNPSEEYIPEEGIVIKHGHDYEIAHTFHPETSIIIDEVGKKYFLPPWGSYYVTRVINKFKEERDHVNAVRPIKKFIINGLIYDTLFTLRFLFANAYYFIMVRFIFFFKSKKNFQDLIKHISSELKLFIDGSTIGEDFFRNRPEAKALIVGHTHDPEIKTYSNGTTFINTGTWTRMYNLDFGKQSQGARLTYAQIDFTKKSKNKNSYFEIANIALNEWKGNRNLPYDEFL